MARERAPKYNTQFVGRIVVPDLIGLSPAEVLQRAVEIGFTAVITDRNGRVVDVSSPWWAVAEQDPPEGSVRYRGDTVVVQLRPDRGGPDAGDREPREPVPPKLTARGRRKPPYERIPPAPPATLPPPVSDRIGERVIHPVD